MKVADALQGVTYLLLDSAPVIYYVEKHPLYFPRLASVFQAIDSGSLTVVVTPVTLAECLVLPVRTGSAALRKDFLDLMLNGQGTEFAPVDDACAEQAAELRARYNLNLLDAFQVSIALNVGCEALLTNDTGLRRVSELSILVVDDLEA